MPALIVPTDIVGRRFGSLIPTKFLRVQPYRYGSERVRVRRDYVYECRCDCGRADVSALRVHLLTGHKTSCGCMWKPVGSSSRRWTGHGEISGVLWSNIRNHARYRELRFDIRIEDAWNKFLAQERSCALTGLPLSFGRTTSGDRTASLDRIVSEIGYTTSNIQWVHKAINVMKMDLSVERFIQLSMAVADHHRRCDQ